MRRVAGCAAALALLLSGCGGAAAGQPVSTQADVAASATTCVAPTGSASTAVSGTWECLGGKGSVDLSRTGGRPLVLVFYAQWCGPCRAEMAVLSRVLPTARGGQVYLVNAGETSYGLSADLLAETGVTGQSVVVDPDWKLMESLGGAHSLPRTFLIGADGRVTRHEGGWKDESSLRAALREVGMTA